MRGEKQRNKAVGSFIMLGTLIPFLLCLMASNLLLSVPVWGGALCLAAETAALRGTADAPSKAAKREDIQPLQKAYAYKAFHRMLAAVVAGMQVTQAMICSYIAVAVDALIGCVITAGLCVFAAFRVVRAFMRRAKGAEPNRVMFCGLLLWLFGVVLFIRSLGRTGSPVVYVALALSALGTAACVCVLAAMEADMRRAGAFALGCLPDAGPEGIQRTRVWLSALAGQALALAGLALIGLLSGRELDNGWSAAFRSHSAFLTVPSMLLVVAAFFFFLAFPLTRLHLEKLRRYTELRQAGGENAALRDQLTAVIVQKSHRPHLVTLIVATLKIFYRHKVIGQENVHLDADTPCVFVCNHGEIYGPVVAKVFLPFPFRPWSAYEMVDREAVIDRTMNGIYQEAKGVKRKLLQWMMEHIGAPFLTEIMREVGSVPVYHDNPRKLMQTFRETVATMQAGDNILVFPENAATSADHRYVREGVSEFFTGFTMIGQMYYNKTGKCPQFIPMYANKRERTITFGEAMRYNPDLPPNDEKERLCDCLRGEMLRLAGMKDK